MEDEVCDKIGRERYQRADGEAEGYRNGYRRGRMKTAEGMMEFSCPAGARHARAVCFGDQGEPGRPDASARGSGGRTLRAWAVDSRHRGHLHRRGWPPAALARGGERDHRAAMGGVRGVHQARSVRVPDRLSLRRWDCRAAARWPPARGGDCGIGEDGRKVLLHLMAGSKEDTETVRAFFQDMRARGLGHPLLVVSDGAPGIIRAIEECFPRSARQRCLAHRMRNLAVKVPTDLWPEFKARVAACYQAPSRAIAPELANGIRADYAATLPSAVFCFEDDFEACIAHLRLPVTHRRATRTTNLLERLFVEERRRLKIIPNGFGEKPVLKLMFGALIRAAERWRGLRFTEFELRQVAAVRKELDAEYEAKLTPSGRSSHPRFSSKSAP